MAKIYRIKQEAPTKFVIELLTASGWIGTANWDTLPEATAYIRHLIDQENFQVKYFDMAGNPIPAN